MKLAAYLHSAPPHRIVGGERMTLSLLEFAQKAGWEVSIVAETFIEPTQYNGMQIVPAREKTLARHVMNGASAVVTHPELIERFNVQNVIGIVHNLSPGTLASIRKHSWRALIANSLVTQKDLAKMGIKTDVVIRPPLLPPKAFVEKRYDYVMSTNMSLLKGADKFIEAARSLQNIPFLGVVGGYNEQELLDLPNLILAGHGPLDLAFGNARLFVTASVSETYGMALAESLAAGLPAIASDIPAHREVAADAAFYISLNADQQAWTQAIKDIYTDQALWQSMHEAAHARCMELKQQTEADAMQWLSLLNML